MAPTKTPVSFSPFLILDNGITVTYPPFDSSFSLPPQRRRYLHSALDDSTHTVGKHPLGTLNLQVIKPDLGLHLVDLDQNARDSNACGVQPLELAPSTFLPLLVHSCGIVLAIGIIRLRSTS